MWHENHRSRLRRHRATPQGTAELAKAFDANVIVVNVARVLAPAFRGIGPIDPADPPERHREQLEHAKAMLSESGIEADCQVALGDPADMILDVAEARGAEMIVVGRRNDMRPRL